MELDELIQAITDAWPTRLQQRAITHVYMDGIPTKAGDHVRIRVLIQTMKEPASPSA